MSKKNTVIAVAYPARGAGNDPWGVGLGVGGGVVFHNQGSTFLQWAIYESNDLPPFGYFMAIIVTVHIRECIIIYDLEVRNYIPTLLCTLCCLCKAIAAVLSLQNKESLD